MSRSGLGRSLCASLVSLTLSLAVSLPSRAAPAQSPSAEGPAAPGASEVPEVAEIQSALEAGDLGSAQALAVARREADPSTENFALEAEVWIAAGDYEQAKRALDDAIAASPESASEDRAALAERREQLDEESRGTRTDEPESSHREELDRDRAERLAALAPVPVPPPTIVDEPKPATPIIKKWYFWVTLGAIVATAGAIVGVAIASSSDERSSDAASRQPAPAGGLQLRF